MSGRVGQGLASENLRAHHVAATTVDGLSVPSNGDLTLAWNANKPPHPDVPSPRDMQPHSGLLGRYLGNPGIPTPKA